MRAYNVRTVKCNRDKVVVSCECVVLNYRNLYRSGVGERKACFSLVFGILDNSTVDRSILGGIQGVSVENTVLRQVVLIV